jgi:hypothetical protein
MSAGWAFITTLQVLIMDSYPQSLIIDPCIVSDDLGTIYNTARNSPLSWVDFKDGVKNPRYKEQVKAGGNATTDFVGLRREVLIDTGCRVNVTYTNAINKLVKKCSGSGYSGQAIPSFPAFAGLSSSADNAALGSFYSKARQAQTSFNGMSFLGELAETIHLIKHPGDSLFKSVHSLMDLYANLVKRYKGRRLGGKQLQRELSGLYLESVFGWLPLMHDIEDAVKAYGRLMDNGPKEVMVRGFGKEAKTTTLTAGVENLYTSSINLKFDKRLSTECQVIYFGKVRADVSGGASIEKAKSLFGFKADEFVPAIWELAPWSFLIDYFTNISEIVSAATFVDANVSWVSKTTRQIGTSFRAGSYDRASSSANASWVAAGGGGYQWQTRSTQVTRVRDAHLSIPGLELSLPGLKTQWANIAALALQSRGMSTTLSRLVRN